MNTEIIKALHTVPPKKLKIIELVNRVTVKGKVDHSKINEGELNLAHAEAHAYVKATQAAVHALRELEAVCSKR